MSLEKTIQQKNQCRKIHWLFAIVEQQHLSSQFAFARHVMDPHVSETLCSCQRALEYPFSQIHRHNKKPKDQTLAYASR